MTLFIETPFNIGDNVIKRNAYGGYRGKIIDIELKKTGDDYAILCLIEYGNRERRWENEMSLEPMEEKE